MSRFFLHVFSKIGTKRTRTIKIYNLFTFALPFGAFPQRDRAGIIHFAQITIFDNAAVCIISLPPGTDTIRAGGTATAPPAADAAGGCAGRNREYREALQANETTMFLIAVSAVASSR